MSSFTGRKRAEKEEGRRTVEIRGMGERQNEAKPPPGDHRRNPEEPAQNVGRGM